MRILAPVRDDGADTTLLLRLDGFEGPLDLLLDLARREKVDLARIDMRALVEQFLRVVEGARRVRLELAADWLVMAAWLAWLKSRLLLPHDPDAAAEAEDAGARLAERLAGLERVRARAAALDALPQLGRDVHRRGAPERLVVIDRSGVRGDAGSLLASYLSAARRRGAHRVWTPVRHDFWTVAAALDRLARMLGQSRGWRPLTSFLPPAAIVDEVGGGADAAGVAPAIAPRADLSSRAALAATLVAGLELVRTGGCAMRQEAPFAPLFLRAVPRG